MAPLIKIVIEETRKMCRKQPIACGFNQSDNAYEPLKLMQTVMAVTNEVCLRYRDNSLLCSLPPPGPPCNTVSIAAIRNSRRRMEDCHVVIHDLSTLFSIQEASPSSYYAIFDGHAGQNAAAYSAAHLHQYLAESQHFITNPIQAFKEAFARTDDLFSDKCKVENLSGGTTAVCCLLRPSERTLYVAWVGDSQVIVVENGSRIRQCVQPHKPNREDEKLRIEQLGGCVLYYGIWRVNGQLAVSRAIGDVEYKPFISAVPDIQEIHLSGNEDFLVLACDGLWDHVSEEDVTRIIYNWLTNRTGDTSHIAKLLTSRAKECGSTDNITVIVVFLRDPAAIRAVGMDAATIETNPFALNGSQADTNPFALNDQGDQSSDLLDIDKCKRNGEDEKTNGKRSLLAEFSEDDDFGPETDVDAVDDFVISSSPPITTTTKSLPNEGENNTIDSSRFDLLEQFLKEECKVTEDLLEVEEKQTLFEQEDVGREETPTPPPEAVHDVSGLIENVAESGDDSEDEWNYIKGDSAEKDSSDISQPDQEVAELSESAMSQLNPDAAEFVPVSPTRSPVCRLINDRVLSQSPRVVQQDIDIHVPKPEEFENEVKNRPHETENGDLLQESDGAILTKESMESYLNNGLDLTTTSASSTPLKVVPSKDEFHFGPNAAPFASRLDQSEAASSTQAVFGDDSVQTLGASFNASQEISGIDGAVSGLIREDIMNASFHQDREDINPFELNKVHVLPDNLEAFLGEGDFQPVTDNSAFNETISDLPEHDPRNYDKKLNNDEKIETTDLDKDSDEKELASPDDDIIEPKSPLSPHALSFSPKEPQDGESPQLSLSPSPDPVIIHEAPKSPIMNLGTISPGPQAAILLEPQLVAISESHSATSPELHLAASPEPQSAASPEPQLAASPELELVASPKPQLASPLIPQPAESPELQHSPSLVGQALSPEPSAPPLEPVQMVPQPVAPELVATSPNFGVCSLSAQSPDLLSPRVVSPEPTVQSSPFSPEPNQFEGSKLVTLTPEPEPTSALSPEPIVTAKIQEPDLCIAVETSEFCGVNPGFCDLTSRSENPNKLTEFELISEIKAEAEKESNSDQDIVRGGISNSPFEDVTSSIKDDMSSPVSPVPVEPIPDVCQTKVSKSELETLDLNTQDRVLCICPSKPEKPLLEIKTDNINREFPEMAIMTPSEDSRLDLEPIKDDSFSAPSQLDEMILCDVKNQYVNLEPFEEVASATIITETIATAVSKTSAEKKPNKKATTTVAKRVPSKSAPLPTKAPAKASNLKPNVSAAKPTSSPRTATTVTKTTKTTVTAAPKPATGVTKAPPKPKTTPGTTANAKKPLSNGDIKPKSSAAKKVTETVTKTTLASTRPPPITRPSPTKAPITRPATAPAKTAPTPKLPTGAAPKPRPTTLAATKTSSKVTTLTSKTITKVASTTSPISKPATAAATKAPRPTTAPAKPRVPLTARPAVSKAPDVEKQSKESANKLKANTRSSPRSSATGVGSTLRKTSEIKQTNGPRTIAKTSTTTSKSNAKKPVEIVRNLKTTTTKVEAPKENGVATLVTEQITTTTVVTSSESPVELQKDNSPLDNKLLIETTAAD